MKQEICEKDVNNLNKNIHQNSISTTRNEENKMFNDYIISTISINKTKSFDFKPNKRFNIALDNQNVKFISKDDYHIKEEKKRKILERKKNFKEFLLRNQESMIRRKGVLERKNLLNEREKIIKSEYELIASFNRLIDDANRRFEARERAELFKKNINSDKKDNVKKYNSKDWNNIYNKRFKNFIDTHNEKIKKAHKEKEDKIKKKEEDIINEMKNQNKKVSKNKANAIFNSLYNKGRKIFNEKKEKRNKSGFLSRNNNEKSINKKNRSSTPNLLNNRSSTPNLLNNRSALIFKNIKPKNMNFFENLNEDTLNKLKQEKSEFENLIKSNIRIKSNKGGIKVYQLNSIQTIKFKKISIIENKEKNYKNESKKMSKTETTITSKKMFTPINYEEEI